MFFILIGRGRHTVCEQSEEGDCAEGRARGPSLGRQPQEAAGKPLYH
jgi:hypothetical protein